MMLPFSAARAVVFPDWGGCLRYEPHATHDLDLAENASFLSASKVCFVILSQQPVLSGDTFEIAG
jgi:hypothetical protein